MVKNYLLFILLSAFAVSCAKEDPCADDPCDDQYIYEDLDTGALNRLSYDGTEQLVFENQQGEQLTFVAPAGLVRNDVEYQGMIDCFQCGWATRYEYQDRQYVEFECDQTNWSMKFDNRLERLDIRFQSITWDGIVAQYDGTTSINQIYNVDQFVHGRISLNGTEYSNVYEFNCSTGIFYFTEQLGIIGFWHPFHSGDLYTLVL